MLPFSPLNAEFRVVSTRADQVESVHRVHVAVSDSDGRLVASAGDPSLITFWRSGAKPFQAMPLVDDGVVDAFGLTTQQLALACASHSSEQGQVSLVRGFLTKVGCVEADLICGPHPPLSAEVARDYEARGVRLSAIHSNCSGKHTGMLALARHHGWPIKDYGRAGHPVQQRCQDQVAKWAGLDGETIGTGVDGCGVVCFALPLVQMASAYAKLAKAGAGSRESGAVVVGAMLKHPDLVAGAGRPCTEIMQAHPGKVVLKVGAAGVYSAGLVREGHGIALKVEDGDARAATLAMAAVLAELGFRGQVVEGLTRQQIRNTRNEVVGELRAEGTLKR